MKRLRHFLRWRRTSSALPLLSRFPFIRKTPQKSRRRRSTAQNPFRRWRLRRNCLDNSQFQRPPKKEVSVGQPRCYSCRNSGHIATSYKFKGAKCNFCKLTGHLEAVCRKKALSKAQAQGVKWIDVLKIKAAPCHSSEVQKLHVPIHINGTAFTLELDTAACGNFTSTRVWTELGKPKLQQVQWRYHSASKHPFSIIGAFTLRPSTVVSASHTQFRVLCPKFQICICLVGMLLEPCGFPWMTCCFPKLRLTRRITSGWLFLDLTAWIDICNRHVVICVPSSASFSSSSCGVSEVCNSRLNLNQTQGPSSVNHAPFAMQEELAQAYDVWIARSIWTPTTFRDWGTPAVPIRKVAQISNKRVCGEYSLCLCGDYSVIVNPQLETHRHPLPRPEELMRRLVGGYGFNKIDIEDAYNPVRLDPKCRGRLALSTHRGFLLQNVLPFGITSSPGYFQQVMDKITSDLHNVAVYLDDILCSGATVEAHLQNLRRLLERLLDKGLRCRLEKYIFAQPQLF